MVTRLYNRRHDGTRCEDGRLVLRGVPSTGVVMKCNRSKGLKTVIYFTFHRKYINKVYLKNKDY